MPQASETQRAQMAKWFPRGAGGFDNDFGVDDGAPYEFLMARGWTDNGGLLSKPTPSYNVSYYEVQILLFLRDEWDYDFHKPLFQEA